jgi:hypothetical protein
MRSLLSTGVPFGDVGGSASHVGYHGPFVAVGPEGPVQLNLRTGGYLANKRSGSRANVVGTTCSPAIALEATLEIEITTCMD